MAGTAVTFTATAATCPNPLYQFLMRPATSSTWQVIQGYSSSNQYHWNSTGAAPGTVYFGVWVKDLSSPGTLDANTSTAFAVTTSPCQSVTISASPTSPQFSGTQVTFTAAASGCTNPSPVYQFLMRPASSSTWQVVQGYSTNGQYQWNSTGAAAGTVYFGVWARDASSSAPYDAVASVPFVVNTASCGSVTIAASPASVVHGSGTHVTITGTAAGCTTSPLYEFWMRPATQSNWQLVQGYSSSNTFNWNSTGATVGTVYFGVWVKDASSSAPVDAFVSTPITVT
ncbi:MAG: hypothetical protein E6I36_10890 [Chloroflexi bacterium]|nr:MAG: hypothetical protein E6I36_10890 [Chloroflexota bacterium]